MLIIEHAQGQGLLLLEENDRVAREGYVLVVLGYKNMCSTPTYYISWLNWGNKNNSELSVLWTGNAHTIIYNRPSRTDLHKVEK